MDSLGAPGGMPPAPDINTGDKAFPDKMMKMGKKKKHKKSEKKSKRGSKKGGRR